MRRLPQCKQPSAGLVIHIASTFGLVYAVLLGMLTVAREQTHREQYQVEAQLATLAAGVSETKADLGQYEARFQAAAKWPQQLTANRDTAVSATDCPLSQIGELNQKRSGSEISWPDGSIASLKLVTLITPEDDLSGSDTLHPEAMIADTAPEPERDASGVTELGRPGISEFARVLAAAGLNIQRSFSQLGLNRAAGGPFVAPRKSPLSGIEPDTLEGIRGFDQVAADVGAAQVFSAREPLRAAARSVQSTVVFSHRARSVGSLHVAHLRDSGWNRHLCWIS